MNGCVYQTADGQCWKFSDKFTNTLSWCVGVNLCKDRKLSNGDRIRAMTDEKFAETITEDWCSIVCPGGSFFCDGDCKPKIIDWLKQEAQCTKD